jgi:hypothetical protein
MVNHGSEPLKNWLKQGSFASLPMPAWMKELLGNSQPILVALQENINALTLQLQAIVTLVMRPARGCFDPVAAAVPLLSTDRIDQVVPSPRDG